MDAAAESTELHDAPSAGDTLAQASKSTQTLLACEKREGDGVAQFLAFAAEHHQLQSEVLEERAQFVLYELKKS